MYEAALSSQDSINHPRTDPLPPWPYPYNRPTKDGSLLRSTSETEGHSCFRSRNHTYTSTMAPGGLPHRIIWDICALWGLLRDDWRIRWKYPGSRTVHTAGARQSWRRAKERGIARMKW